MNALSSLHHSSSTWIEIYISVTFQYPHVPHGLTERFVTSLSSRRMEYEIVCSSLYFIIVYPMLNDIFKEFS